MGDPEVEGRQRPRAAVTAKVPMGVPAQCPAPGCSLCGLPSGRFPQLRERLAGAWL